MKPREVGIIVAVVAVIALLWWKNHSSDAVCNPTNATSSGFKNQGPARSGVCCNGGV